jgi:VanZ family protein
VESINVDNWRGRVRAYAPLVIWIGVIFLFSSPAGASAETSRFIQPMIQFFFPNASPDTFQTIHLIIRKTAHLTEYGILSFLAVRAFRLSGFAWKSFVLALVVVLVVAALDEFNQSFEPSRTSAVSDVFLDLSGGSIVAFCLYLFGRMRRKQN